MSPSFKAFARLFSALPVSCLLLAAVARSEPAIPGLSIYPKGNVFPFLGYSGIPARDAKNGFSVTGPDYGTPFHAPPLERERKLKARGRSRRGATSPDTRTTGCGSAGPWSSRSRPQTPSPGRTVANVACSSCPNSAPIRKTRSTTS